MGLISGRVAKLLFEVRAGPVGEVQTVVELENVVAVFRIVEFEAKLHDEEEF